MNNSFIGVFDSGYGGLTTLKELQCLLPNENYIYLGDTKNAPYGDKDPKEVEKIVLKIVDYLVKEKVKAIVVACNTATSIAIKSVREKYKDLIIIGTEPAVKVAVDNNKDKILVLATKNTLKLEKFTNLVDKLNAEDKIIKEDLEGLATLIDKGNLDSEEIDELLNKKLSKYKGKIDSVVLGCTHYPFVKDKIYKLLEVPIYDGNNGIARELKRRLSESNLLNYQDIEGTILYKSTGNELDYEKMYRLLGDK